MSAIALKRTEPARVAYSIAEFAALFGKKRLWAYDLAKKGKIRTLTGYGKTMVPAAEVERILSEGSSND